MKEYTFEDLRNAYKAGYKKGVIDAFGMAGNYILALAESTSEKFVEEENEANGNSREIENVGETSGKREN